MSRGAGTGSRGGAFNADVATRARAKKPKLTAYESEVKANEALDDKRLAPLLNAGKSGITFPKELVDADLAMAERIIGTNEDFETLVIFGKNGAARAIITAGQGASVSFNAKEAKLLAGAVVTHNHPSGSSLSRADIIEMRKNNIKELRAVGVTDGMTYSMSPPRDSLFWKTSADKIFATHAKVRKEIFAQLGYSGGKDYNPLDHAPREVQIAVINQSALAMDKIYGLNYKIIQSQ
jgi:hypothetical protein